MRKDDLICVYKDTEHETKTRTLLKEAQSNVIKAMEVYKALTGEEITAKNFEDFIQSGASMVTKHFESTVNIPVGHSRAAYLKLLQYPDVSKLTNLLKAEYKEFLSFDGEVKIHESANIIIEKNNVYLSKQEKRVYDHLEAFVSITNMLLKHNTKLTTAIVASGHAEILQQDGYPHGEYQLKLENAIHFIKSK